MLPEGVSMRSQGLGVSIFDKPNHLFHTPTRWVLTSRTLALSGVWHWAVTYVAQEDRQSEDLMLKYLAL